MKKEVPYENCEYLVRLLKKRNFDHQFIWGIALSTDSDELLGELASFIEENAFLSCYNMKTIRVPKNCNCQEYWCDEETEIIYY